MISLNLKANSTSTRAVIAGVAAFITMVTILFLQSIAPGYALLMAPFGATAVIIFALPKSPLAKAKNIIIGHVLTACIGFVMLKLFGDYSFALAFAVAAAITLMMLGNVIHPPAGANPIVVFTLQPGIEYLFAPVLLGAVCMAMASYGYKRLSRVD